MGNISPRSSKSFPDGFTNHLTLTPSRSSWKKQLQFINKTLHIKKLSRNHANNKIKRTESTFNHNHDFDRKLTKSHIQENHVKKSFSLFSMKQSLNDLTNKENQPVNSTNPPRSRPKIERVKVNKRHSTFIPSTYVQQYQIQLSSKTDHDFSSSHSADKTTTTTTTTTVTRRTIIQASTSELLHCLSEYLCSTCSHLLPRLDRIDCILWIKSVDRQLILQGWQEQVFVNPANIVFFYLILRETLTSVVPSSTIKRVQELHSIVLTCLYLSFSYMGNEISYPLKPFVTDNETRLVFWQRVVLIMGQLSSKMLAINQNPKFFTECFSDLKQYNLVHK